MAQHRAYTIEFQDHPDYDHPFETNTAEGDIDVAYQHARKTFPDGLIVGHHIRWWDDEDGPDAQEWPEREPVVKRDDIDIHDFIQKIEDRPALQIKRALMSYFGESFHQGFEGWHPSEVATLNKFMTDFILGLESGMDDNYEQDFGIMGVDVSKKD